MRQSKVEGIMVLYIALQAWTMVLQQSTTGDANVWSALQNMWYVNILQMTGSSFSAVGAAAAGVVSVILAFLSAVLLYYPAIFQGTFIWFWWCVCLPVAIGFVISFITIMKGVGSS